ncbi:DUF4376 domain-containing protein [Caballeronia sp. Sq4a]|uniref:DUF4376 domain-containing protein n=1 Tax=Caballeronia sp. Sq4a TaxID=2878152 RepID=UPI0020BF2298|nr:DUF4376 domain-containing protein [Caballeronia sp. Sq4a]
MTTIYVQFSDLSESKIIGAFSCPQDADAYPNQGEIDVLDARYQAFVNPASTLPGAKLAQSLAIDAAYAAAVQSSVTFKTAAGISQTFQADADSQDILAKATQGYTIAGEVPPNFFWKAEDNTLVAFTLADLQGLYGAMLAQGWVAFQKRATLKAQISAATSVSAVQAIAW